MKVKVLTEKYALVQNICFIEYSNILHAHGKFYLLKLPLSCISVQCAGLNRIQHQVCKTKLEFPSLESKLVIRLIQSYLFNIKNKKDQANYLDRKESFEH